MGSGPDPRRTWVSQTPAGPNSSRARAGQNRELAFPGRTGSRRVGPCSALVCIANGQSALHVLELMLLWIGLLNRLSRSLFQCELIRIGVRTKAVMADRNHLLNHPVKFSVLAFLVTWETFYFSYKPSILTFEGTATRPDFLMCHLGFDWQGVPFSLLLSAVIITNVGHYTKKIQRE